MATPPLSRRSLLLAAAAPAGTFCVDCQSHLFVHALLDWMEKREGSPRGYRKGEDRYLVIGDWHRRILPKHTDVKGNSRTWTPRGYRWQRSASTIRVRSCLQGDVMQAGAAKQRGCVPEKSRGRQLELEEAVAIVGKIASPAVESMFDTHNTVAEKLPHDELIRRHFRHICHVHLNEMDGRHPGVGDHDFGKVLQALKDLRYSGWMSVEVFDLKLGARTIAEQSVAFLRKLEAGLT